MATESVRIRYRGLDAWPLDEAVEAMWEAQLGAVAAVRGAAPAIVDAALAAAERLGESGRLIYAGAGASGRIAAQDGAELSPTFGWPDDRVVFLLAGGEAAMLRSVEGAEDDGAAARQAIEDAGVNASDVAIAVAASGSTPFTIEALNGAKARGALAIAMANNAGAGLFAQADYRIFIPTGGEVVAGSTRMKAGAAQKVALSLLSTAIMMRLGGVYEGMMVGMRPVNAKLRARAVRMVMDIAGCDEERARSALAQSRFDVKLAALRAFGAPVEDAREWLAQARGDLRQALARMRAADSRLLF